MIANISVNWKYVAVTMHRLIYSTFKEISYSGNYLVWHFDDDCKNNSLDNLYWIYWSKKEKQNTDHKKCAYKLLEMYVKWELYDSNWNRLSMWYDLRLD